MKHFFLLNYDVKGIKTLDKNVSLSFYKKTISKPVDTQRYCVKGIYGMNGSGKSGIVASVDILKRLLINTEYLNNPVVQDSLEAMINKRTKELSIGANYLVAVNDQTLVYKYRILLKKNVNERYVIDSEELSYKTALSKKDEYKPLIKIRSGEIESFHDNTSDYLKDAVSKKTANLLSSATISSLFKEKFYGNEMVMNEGEFLSESLLLAYLFGCNIFAYSEESDDHTNYLLNNKLEHYFDIESEVPKSDEESLFKYAYEMSRNLLNVFSVKPATIRKDSYANYTERVKRLERFIKIFKSDLTAIEIEKKEDGDAYVCGLNMVYGDYKVNAEFESTGIKKLIKLFAYFQEMVMGGIVFVDEMDSNLHDVYLCALLEYLMVYGEGQLCFTTHNVGPMDVLKRNKKSIDFLSIDHVIHPWTTNGNYSPSNLYRLGMIEGSPFNVDSIDFIGVFETDEEE